MFKLLGTDQKEYGPVSADQIRQWIAQGRTKAQAAGTTDWKPLTDFPEFADALQATAPPAGQPAPAAGAQPPAASPKASGLAMTSLVLGCLGLFTCGITALVGLILGIIALVRINKSNGQLGGQGMAMAANRVNGIRAAVVWNEAVAKETREANDSNVLSLAADFMTEDEALKIVDTWLATDFSKAERYIRRNQELEDL